MKSPLTHLTRYHHQSKDYLTLSDGVTPAVTAQISFDEALKQTPHALKRTMIENQTPLPQGAYKKAILSDRARVFCVGKNYLKHAQEMGGDAPPAPDIFTRTHESFVTDGEAIITPTDQPFHDYEGELAVMIGKSGRNIPESDALDHIFGYGAANDGSIRNWQKRTSQFTLGKNWDQSGALSADITLASPDIDPQKLYVTTQVNGQTVQSQTTTMMIFSAKVIIQTLSQMTTLRTGDIILTGTPEGVGTAQKPPRYLQAGDHVSVLIQTEDRQTRIAATENTVTAQRK